MALQIFVVKATEDRLPPGRVIMGQGVAETDDVPVFLFFPADEPDMVELDDVTDEETLSMFLEDLERSGWWDDACDVDRQLLEGIAANSIPAELLEAYIDLNREWYEEVGVHERLMELEDDANEAALDLRDSSAA